MAHKINIDAESEQAIRARIAWQKDRLIHATNQYGANSIAAARIQAYISALQWVLESAGLPLEKI